MGTRHRDQRKSTGGCRSVAQRKGVRKAAATRAANARRKGR